MLVHEETTACKSHGLGFFQHALKRSGVGMGQPTAAPFLSAAHNDNAS